MATISAVYPDPRGKVTHGGKEREHCFTIRTTDQVLVRRYETASAAVEARAELISDERG